MVDGKMTTFIADAGINHNGDRQLAFRLVDAAVEAGADVVKFQTFTHIDALKRYELKWETYIELKKYCDSNGIEFLSTPHTFESIHFLDNIVSRFKIASCYLYIPNFLKEVAKKNKPIILSTGNFMSDDGMATIEEIKNALSFIPDADITLLHCVSKYPCENPHYRRIVELKELGKPVGLSDHNKNIYIPRGLPIVEKHLMISNVDCIDQDVSMIAQQFRKMVEYPK